MLWACAGRCQIRDRSFTCVCCVIPGTAADDCRVVCLWWCSDGAPHVPARRHPCQTAAAAAACTVRDATRATVPVWSCRSTDQCDPIWRRDTLPSLPSVNPRGFPLPPSAARSGRRQLHITKDETAARCVCVCVCDCVCSCRTCNWGQSGRQIGQQIAKKELPDDSTVARAVAER